MVLSLSGLNRIRDLVAADVDYGQMGTSTATVSESNTALGTAVPSTELAIDTTTTVKAIQFDYTLPSTVGTATTYTEFSLYGNGTAIFYDRIVFTGIEHTDEEDIIITKTYFLEGA